MSARDDREYALGTSDAEIVQAGSAAQALGRRGVRDLGARGHSQRDRRCSTSVAVRATRASIWRVS